MEIKERTEYYYYLQNIIYKYSQGDLMNGVVSIQLEWVYTPEDYFHSPLSIPCEGGTIAIDNGTVMAEVDPHAIKDDQSIAQKLDDQVENLFHEEQVKSSKPYELGMPFKVVINNDGSRIVSPA